MFYSFAVKQNNIALLSIILRWSSNIHPTLSPFRLSIMNKNNSNDTHTNGPTVGSARKSRTKHKLTEPLRITPGFDRNGNPVYFIRGWITDTIRCNRQCPRNGTPASLAAARRIRDEEEFRRAQLLGDAAATVALRLTRLTEDQLRDCEAALQALERAKGRGVAKHVLFAIQNMYDFEKSKPLAEAVQYYIEERNRDWKQGHIRHGHYLRSVALLNELVAFYPNISVHDLAFVEIVEPPPLPPKLPLKFYARLLGTTIKTLINWRTWYNARNPMPLPTLVYTPTAWTWNREEVEALRVWLRDRQAEGSVAKLPEVMPTPPVAAPLKIASYPRSRLEIFCERATRRGKNGMLASSTQSRPSLQGRRHILMHFVRFAKKRKWIDQVPDFDSYLKHSQREHGRAACLSVREAEDYMRWFETNHPEFACREAIKLFATLRPDGESDRLEAWVNPSTCASVPQVAQYKSKPSPAAIGLWQAVRTELVGDKDVHACGLIAIEAAVSKVRTARFSHIPPNLALWVAVYHDVWKLGSWSQEVRSSDLRSFDSLADHYYKTHDLDWVEREKLRKVVQLAHDVLRHTGISYFTARYGSFTAASLESGVSPQIIKTNYYSLRTGAEADQFYRILPRGWSWGADRKTFVPPPGWIRPTNWILPLQVQAEAAA